MPRKSKVPLEDRIDVVKKFMKFFVTTELPEYTSTTWEQMSIELNGRWTPHDVYINVRENRQHILSTARDELGIVVLDVKNEVPPPHQINETAINDEASSSEDDVSSSLVKNRKRQQMNDSTWSPDKKRKRREINHNEEKTTEFELLLSAAEWAAIKPDGTVLYGNKSKFILQRGTWTNVISIAFWQQYKTNCAFVFKRANVTTGPEEDSYIVDMFGRCKSSACGNTFFGHGEKRPDSEGLIIHVNTRDTRLESHDDVKRPLNGRRRKEAAQEMIREGCAVWKRRQARKYMEDGDLEPMFLPNGDVLRQAKKEAIHNNLKVNPGDGRDLIRTIENLVEDPEYLDLIHAVGSSPVYVFYGTPSQMDAYKKYIRLNRAKSKICVDATRSVVRKLDRPRNTKTGHIFLYSIVVNFEGITQPVHQMISEKHVTEFIEYWLKQWLRKGAPKPKEAISDDSRALISALCLAFSNRTIKSYLNICFAIIENTRGVVERPPTVIRIDVAHLVHMVCRWKCFDKANQSCIKDFFVRCVALMVECETLPNFQTVFTLTCAVGLQTHEDSTLKLPLVHTTKEARYKLEDYIATRRIEEKLKAHTPRHDEDYTAGPFEFDASEPDVDVTPTEKMHCTANSRVFKEAYDANKLDDDTKAGSRLVEWITDQKERAEKTERLGRDANAFYFPDFIERLLKLAKEFPLWTGVSMPCDSPHATSSYVESYFNDIKTRVFTTEVTLPARVDLFLKHLARNIIGETLLFVAKLKKAEMKQAALDEAEAGQAKVKHADPREAETGLTKVGQEKKCKGNLVNLERTESREAGKKQIELERAEPREAEKKQIELERSESREAESREKHIKLERAESREFEKKQIELERSESREAELREKQIKLERTESREFEKKTNRTGAN